LGKMPFGQLAEARLILICSGDAWRKLAGSHD
jgi:hypothetical protein